MVATSVSSFYATFEMIKYLMEKIDEAIKGYKTLTGLTGLIVTITAHAVWGKLNTEDFHYVMGFFASLAGLGVVDRLIRYRIGQDKEGE